MSARNPFQLTLGTKLSARLSVLLVLSEATLIWVATPLYDAIIQACLEAGFSPRIVSEAVTPHGVLFGVAGGSLVSITFSTMKHFYSKGIFFTPFSHSIGQLNLVLEYRKTGMSERDVQRAAADNIRQWLNK